MQLAIESIVNTYVRYGNRAALQELWRIRNNLKIRLLPLASSGFDPGRTVAKCEEELAVIEAGLAKLTLAAAA
jgi:hypothetical protein